jgi:hypothetical protein
MGDPTQPRIGVVWAAGDWNPARSVPFPSIKRLLEIPGCEFWNLQGGFAHDAWFSLPGNKRFRDVAECGDGVVTLAAVISQLDLVVTVDTLAAHLAGAIGIPAWVLLERDADWRWMSNRSETPWYPTLRLYRQAEQADWDSLISIVSEQLKVHLG